MRHTTQAAVKTVADPMGSMDFAVVGRGCFGIAAVFVEQEEAA